MQIPSDTKQNEEWSSVIAGWQFMFHGSRSGYWIEIVLHVAFCDSDHLIWLI